MRRRALLFLLGGGAAAWPLGGTAQEAKKPTLGVLSGGGASRWLEQIAPSFRQGLVEGGYSGGRTVTIEGRYAEGHFERLPALAADLLNQQVALVATISLPAALAAKEATTKIPIVFVVGEDPVEVGLVDKLNRPGGNITGISNFANVLAAKRLELLRELVSDGTLFGLLVNPNNPNAEPDAQVVRAAAEALGIKLLVVKAGSEPEIDRAFATLLELRTRALCVNVDPFFMNRAEQIATLAIRNRLPVIYPRREFVIAGGLISYDSSYTDSFRQSGIYAGRILNGEKPADLPVQQATRIELTVNLRAASALDLAIPQSLLARTDEVIE